MKVEFAINRLKIDFSNQLEYIIKYRGLLHKNAIAEHIDLAKQLRNAIKILASVESQEVSENEAKEEICSHGKLGYDIIACMKCSDCGELMDSKLILPSVYSIFINT